MTRYITIVLRLVILLVGIGAVGMLLWEPQLEGRNTHATLFQIYFDDPFLMYVYIASIPFFVALYQTSNLLAAIGQGDFFSQRSMQSLRVIKHCAITSMVLIAIGAAFLLFVNPDPDGRPQVVFMSSIAALFSLIAASAAAMFETRLRNAIRLKSGIAE